MKQLAVNTTNELIDIANKTLFANRISLNTMEDAYFGKYIKTKDKKLISITSLPFSFEKILDNKIDNLYNFDYCLSCNNTTHVKNFPTGNLKPKTFVIGIAPGFANIKSFGNDRIFSYGKTADYLKYALIKLGIHSTCWYTNIIKCSVKDNRNITITEADNCKIYLLNEIMTLKPFKAIVLGIEAKLYFDKNYKKYFKEIFYCIHPSSFVRNNNIESYYEYMKGIINE